MHKNTLELWDKERFPRIIARKLYPKGGPFVRKKKGEPREDSSHKMCIVFEYETVNHNRIAAALEWVKFNGWHKAIFGEFAVLTYPPGDDAEKGERDRYRGMLEDHGRCTRGYDVSSIPGLINAHYKVPIEITSGRNNEFVSTKELCVHDLLRKVKVTMADGKCRNVIQCIFLTKGGDYNLWYPGNNAAMKAKALEILANAAAYLKHQTTRWGMNETGCMLLIEKSFDQYSARSAKSSRWDTKNQKVIAVNLDFAGEDSRNFRENFLGIVGSVEAAPTAKATVVVSSGNKDGEIGNFDFNRDNASVNTIHTKAAQRDDGSAATGFQTVANYNRNDEVSDAATIRTEVGAASAGGDVSMADDATGFESRSYCPLNNRFAANEVDDDDVSEMTGFTQYNDDGGGQGGNTNKADAEESGGWEELAEMGRKIGSEGGDATVDQLAKDFAEFLKSRGRKAEADEVEKSGSLLTQLDSIRMETEALKLARAAQRSEMAPGADVGKGPAGQTAGGASSRRDGNPKGEAGKGADDQRSDDPG
jgi:hypothetical protein